MGCWDAPERDDVERRRSVETLGRGPLLLLLTVEKVAVEGVRLDVKVL